LGGRFHSAVDAKKERERASLPGTAQGGLCKKKNGGPGRTKKRYYLFIDLDEKGDFPVLYTKKKKSERALMSRGWGGGEKGERNSGVSRALSTTPSAQKSGRRD